ncbi:ANTH domain-containing protein [Spinellus fusiger]|nr:ANTH domain-containing protein [Spinellus fusiger]
MNNAIRKATRLEYKASKEKHMKTLIGLTFQNPASVADIIKTLDKRAQEHSWIISFKVLIIMHTLMRQGNENKVLEYLSQSAEVLHVQHLQGRLSNSKQLQNMHIYKSYLDEKLGCYKEFKIDFVKSTSGHNDGHLRHLSISKGLLKETSALQKQINSVLKCKFYFDKGDNAISLHAYALVISDLIVLFKALNEGIVNILEHYFAMDKHNAKISLDIYKRFSRQTTPVVDYLNHAGKMQSELNVTIPTVKHAPLSLVEALEEYLLDLEKRPNTPQEPFSSKPKDPPPPLRTVSQQHPPYPPSLPTPDFFTSLEHEKTTVFIPSHSTEIPPMQQPMMTGFHSLPVTTHLTGNPRNPFRNSIINPHLFTAPLDHHHSNGTIPQPIYYQQTADSAQYGTNPMYYTLPRTVDRNNSNPFKSMTAPMPQKGVGFNTPRLQPLITGQNTAANPFAPASPPPTPQHHRHTFYSVSSSSVNSPTASVFSNNPFVSQTSSTSPSSLI